MIACLRLPQLALVAAWHRDPALRGRPLVLGGLAYERGLVMAASDEARAAGVRESMTLQRAEQCSPTAVFQPVDEEAVGALRTRVLATLYAFTPAVSTGATEGGYAFLDLDGLQLHWPDRGRLLVTIASRVAAVLQAPPAIGVGASLFVSQVAADRARAGAAEVVEDAPAYLAPLPLDVIPLEADMRGYLDLLGVRTLGALRSIARPAWRRQFGPAALPLYDLAFGIDPTPLRPWRAPARLEEAMPLEPPLDNMEAVQFVARALADRVSASLLARGLGTRHLLVLLDQEAAARLQLTVRFTYPITLATDLFDGIRPPLLRVRPQAPITRITLRVRQLEPAHVRQSGLLLRRDGLRESVADAVARLQEEHGMTLIQRATLIGQAPPIPGRRIRWSPA